MVLFSSIATQVLRWNFSRVLVLVFVVISASTNISQSRTILSLENDIEVHHNTLPNSHKVSEIAQVKFITGLRNKRDLTARDFHIIQIFRPSTNSTTEIHLSRKESLVSSDFKIVVRNGDDEPETLSGEDAESNCLYHGSIPSDPGGKAAFSSCGGHGHFGFSGLIMSRDGHWMIEPHPVAVKEFQETLAIPHAILLPETSEDQSTQQCNTDELRVPPEDLQKAAERDGRKREKDDDNNETSDEDESLSLQTSLLDSDQKSSSGSLLTYTLASKGSKGSKSTKRQTKSNSSTKKTVEIAVFTDADFYNQMKIRYPKDTMTKVKNYVLTVVNAMDLLYEQQSLGTALAFRLVHLDIQKKQPTKLDKHGGKAKQYLTSFCDYAGDMNTKNQLWDHALMLTGADLVEDGSSATAGLAWAGTMCYRYYSCSLSEATQFGVVYVITHEIGHSMGMEHDGEGVSSKCDKEKYLMSPTTGPGKVSWSSCSNQNLQDFIKYGTSEEKSRASSVLPDCLTETARESPTIDYTSSSRPGEKYDAEKQCHLALGKKFTPTMKNSAPFNNICSMLYCGNATHSVSSHPALEGTQCGTGKRCTGGSCK